MLCCSICDEKCKIKRIDESFSHLFGLENCSQLVSDCCESEVYNDLTGKELTQFELTHCMEDYE